MYLTQIFFRSSKGFEGERRISSSSAKHSLNLTSSNESRLEQYMPGERLTDRPCNRQNLQVWEDESENIDFESTLGSDHNFSFETGDSESSCLTWTSTPYNTAVVSSRLESHQLPVPLRSTSRPNRLPFSASTNQNVDGDVSLPQQQQSLLQQVLCD